MIRWLFIRFLLPLFAFLIVRAVLKAIARTFSQVMSAPPSGDAAHAAGPAPSGGELKKDPVCGTYVSESSSVTGKFGRELVHFCSPECRDKYQAT
jgi:YHS domain-containing protein